MNLDTLDLLLTTLSPSEQKYRFGLPYHNWDNLEKVLHNGREVYMMEINDPRGPSLDNGGLLSQYESVSPVSTARISVKRNSRFNPVPEHVHSYIEINYVYSGVCPQIIDRTPVTLKKDQVLLIDTNCPHSIPALGGNDIMLSLIVQKEYFSFDFLLSLFRII